MIADFWVDAFPEATEEGPVPGRMATFMVGHCIFFMFNFLNVCYLVLFEMYTFQRFHKNILLQFGFVACFVQIFSCITSIHRYNIDDEYGIWNQAGVYIGLVDFCFFNFTDLYLIFQPKGNETAVRLGMCFWVIMTIVNGYDSMVNWEEKTTGPFQMYVGLSTLSHVVALIVFRKYVEDGTVSVESVAPKDTILRLLKVLIIVDALCLGAAGLKKPILSYPVTGCTFTVMVIAMTFIGRMDFMTGNSAAIEAPAPGAPGFVPQPRGRAVVPTETQPLRSNV